MARSGWGAPATPLTLLLLCFGATIVAPCSFIVVNADLRAAQRPDGTLLLPYANALNRRRGPDFTNVVALEGWTFVHNLLHMTGERTLQPFMDAERRVVALFNGEIYNYKELERNYAAPGEQFLSDGYAIIATYLANGRDGAFVRRLHGEFALVVVDFERGVVTLSTDTFATKPLWYAVWNDGDGQSVRFATTSYRSVLERMGVPSDAMVEVAANTVLELSLLGEMAVTGRWNVFDFDLRQHKNTTDDFINALRKSVADRTKGIIHKAFVGLSDGFDSGSVFLNLCELGVPLLAYTILGKEDTAYIEDRVRSCAAAVNATVLVPSQMDFAAEEQWLRANAEPYFNRVNISGFPRMNFDDSAFVGLSMLLREVGARGGRIYLSAGGADEIISDYADPEAGRLAVTSCFGGRFPPDLTTIFPWCNFYDGSQRAYIMKEETVGGSHGIETRYPFLDPHVVQEYLWLSHDLKNSRYKRPLVDLFARFHFPLRPRKMGFAVRDGLHRRHTSAVPGAGVFSDAVSSSGAMRLELASGAGDDSDEAQVPHGTPTAVDFMHSEGHFASAIVDVQHVTEGQNRDQTFAWSRSFGLDGRTVKDAAHACVWWRHDALQTALTRRPPQPTLGVQVVHGGGGVHDALAVRYWYSGEPTLASLVLMLDSRCVAATIVRLEPLQQDVADALDAMAQRVPPTGHFSIGLAWLPSGSHEMHLVALDADMSVLGVASDEMEVAKGWRRMRGYGS